MRSIIIIFCLSSVLCSSPIVKVEEGELAGTPYELPNGQIVNAFLGVPYAAPPVFNNRFKEPQKLKPWIGTWNATKIQSVCLQIGHRTLYEIAGEEDCLYLNIYTPKLPVKNGVNPMLSVMFYIHGGAFMFGSGGTIYPDYILQNNDIVFVSVNYRLGVLGFLSTGDDIAPGNFGLKDQVAALKWVQRNIIHFGGNPNDVTIAGCSAGGASVHYHFLSPMSEGLFQKGISMSGTVLPRWTLPRNVPQKSTHVAALVGCPTSNTKDMIKCLQSRPARAVVEHSKYFLTWRYCPFTPFGPVVEPPAPNAFLSSQPIDLLKNGKVRDLPWMTNIVDKEGLYPGSEFIAQDNLLQELNDKWNEIAPNLLMYNYSVPEQEKDRISAAIKKFYFGDKPISKETTDQIIQMLGDRLFFNEIFEASKLHNLVTKKNVYCYKFSYPGKYSITNVYAKNTERYGASHSDDLMYIVKFFNSNSQETETDAAMTKLMSSIYVNFMKTGNPSHGIDVWKPIPKDRSSSFNCLNIYSSNNVVFEDIANPATSDFWKNILHHEYQVKAGNERNEL